MPSKLYVMWQNIPNWCQNPSIELRLHKYLEPFFWGQPLLEHFFCDNFKGIYIFTSPNKFTKWCQSYAFLCYNCVCASWSPGQGKNSYKNVVGLNCDPRSKTKSQVQPTTESYVDMTHNIERGKRKTCTQVIYILDFLRRLGKLVGLLICWTLGYCHIAGWSSLPWSYVNWCKVHNTIVYNLYLAKNGWKNIFKGHWWFESLL